MKKQIFFMGAAFAAACIFLGCSVAEEWIGANKGNDVTQKNSIRQKEDKRHNMSEVLYQGHGSLRITASDGTVIYIDPFAGDGYDKPADLILVTHQHSDHNVFDKPARKANCVVWQNTDALIGGKYIAKTFGSVKVEPVPAYNKNHSKDECVGYVLYFDGLSVYIAGDTSKTAEMSSLAAKRLDWAFLPCDGVYNMGPAEASACAAIIKAKRNVPYHTAPGSLFSRKQAELFKAEGRVILEAGETLKLQD